MTGHMSGRRASKRLKKTNTSVAPSIPDSDSEVSFVEEPSAGDGNLWQLKDCSGTLAPFNHWAHSVLDEKENKLYVLGGRRTDRDETVGDFYCFDQSAKRWEDLSKRLKYRNVGNPFCKESKAFPNLFDPAVALVRLSETGCPFIFVFSGYDEDSAAVAPNLLAIDLETLEWFDVQTSGQSGPSRIDSAMVYSTAQKALFIFGGRSELEDDAMGIPTYSVIQYEGEGWRWTTPEAHSPYLQGMGYNIRSLSLFGGKKILLAPGRNDALSSLIDLSFAHLVQFCNITGDRILFFDTFTQRFNAQTQLETRIPPNKVKYYDILEGSYTLPAASTSKKRQYHNLKEPRYPCVLFVCTLRDSGTEELLNTSRPFFELWKYAIFPEDRIECLGHALKINNALSAEGFSIQETSINHQRGSDATNIKLIFLGNQNDIRRHERSSATREAISDSLQAEYDPEIPEGHHVDIRDVLEPMYYCNKYAEIDL